MSVCKNCGFEFNDGTYCPHCGTQIDLTQPETNSYQSNIVPPVQNYNPQPVEEPGKGKGIASMVLGIIAVLPVCCGTVGIILGIISFILGLVANSESKKAGNKNGYAIAGIVLSILSWVIPLIILSLYVFLALIYGMSTPIEMGTMADSAGSFHY